MDTLNALARARYAAQAPLSVAHDWLVRRVRVIQVNPRLYLLEIETKALPSPSGVTVLRGPIRPRLVSYARQRAAEWVAWKLAQELEGGS